MTHHADPFRLLTPKEAAKILRTKPRTLRRWAARGIIRTEQRTAGRHRRFSRAEVESLRDRLSAGLMLH